MRVGQRAAISAVVLAGLSLPSLATAADPAAPASAGLHVASFQAPSRVFLGERATLKGKVAPAAAVPVLLERLENGAWVPIMTVQSTAAGTFAATLALPPGSVRATVQGPDGVVQSSPRRSIAVVRRMTLAVTAQPLESISGRPFRATGVAVGRAQGRAPRPAGLARRHRLPHHRAPARAVRARRGRLHPAGGRQVALPAGGRADPGPRLGRRRRSPRRRWPSSAPTPTASRGRHPTTSSRSSRQFQLYYYENGKLRRVFPVVFGKPSTPTPVGRFAVYSKTAGPSAAFGPLVLWYHRGYGIHGTNQEYLLSRSWRLLLPRLHAQLQRQHPLALAARARRHPRAESGVVLARARAGGPGSGC